MHNLYFVAIIPPDDIFAEVHAFKERMADKYQSQGAMRQPVHITLFPPVEMHPDAEDRFEKLLDDIASRHHAFDVHLNGFAAFPPKVIYVKPEKELKMNVISREIVDTFIHHISPAMALRTFKFKAHMTIAYRDLLPEFFPGAWGEFKDKQYQRTFAATEISLLRQDGPRWNVIHRAKLLQEKEATEQSLDLFG